MSFIISRPLLFILFCPNLTPVLSFRCISTEPYPVTTLGPSEITTDSVTLVWMQPESKPDYTYYVEYSNGTFINTTTTNSTTISQLLSGSNYSFTVITLAADGTRSDPATVSNFTRMYTCKPSRKKQTCVPLYLWVNVLHVYWSRKHFVLCFLGPLSITGLRAETLNTTAVRLSWNKPPQYKPEYTYRVETTGCGSKSEKVQGEGADISALTPGTNCTFCVFVRAANGIEGDESCTSQYTSKTSHLSFPFLYFILSRKLITFNPSSSAPEQNLRRCSPASPAREPTIRYRCHGPDQMAEWSFITSV